MKNIIMIVLGVLLCLMSLLLALAMPLVGILGIVGGICCIVYGVKKRREPSAPADPAPAAPSAPVRTVRKSTPRPDGVPSRKYDKTATVKLSGVTFKCQNDPSSLRQDILSGMSDGDLVLFEEYEYKGKPAFLVVEPFSGLDVGTLPADVSALYSGRELEGYLTGLDSFYPDDSDDLVYYSKVKFFVLQEAADAES